MIQSKAVKAVEIATNYILNELDPKDQRLYNNILEGIIYSSKSGNYPCYNCWSKTSKKYRFETPIHFIIDVIDTSEENEESYIIRYIYDKRDDSKEIILKEVHIVAKL